MAFFEDIDGIKIIERNVTRLEGVELSEARRLVKMFRQAKEEIKSRLLATPDNTFTEARLRTMLSQIDQGLQVLSVRVNNEAELGFETMTEQGAEDSAKEINAFERQFNGITGLLPVQAIVESVDPENFLFNQYKSSIDSYSQNLRSEFQRILGQSLLQRKTWSQAVFDMEQVFTGSEWRLARIARTELHQIYNVSKMNGFIKTKENYLPDLKKTMYHPIDARTGEDSRMMANKEMIVALDKPFVFKYNGETQRFMAPPNRPNDRAILIPYRESYDNRS